MDIQRFRDNWKAFVLDTTVVAVYFLIVQIGGIFFAGRQPSPESGASGPAGSVPPAQFGVEIAIVYIVVFLLVTGGMLLIIKKKKTGGVKYIAYPIIYFTFASGLFLLGVGPIVSMVVSIAAPVAFAKYRTWYVVTFIGLVISTVSVGAFGAIWTPAAALLFIAVLTIYDIIAVYVTGHMQTLARGVGDKLPLFVVVPHTASVGVSDIFESDEDERVATALGLGDLVIPSMLVVIAAQRVGPTIVTLGEIPLTASAIGGMVGTLVGIAVLNLLLYAVEHDGHAGLPPLNTGVFLGYLLGGLAAGVSIVTLLGL